MAPSFCLLLFVLPCAAAASEIEAQQACDDSQAGTCPVLAKHGTVLLQTALSMHTFPVHTDAEREDPDLAVESGRESLPEQQIVSADALQEDIQDDSIEQKVAGEGNVASAERLQENGTGVGVVSSSEESETLLENMTDVLAETHAESNASSTEPLLDNQEISELVQEESDVTVAHDESGVTVEGSRRRRRKDDYYEGSRRRRRKDKKEKKGKGDKDKKKEKDDYYEKEKKEKDEKDKKEKKEEKKEKDEEDKIGVIVEQKKDKEDKIGVTVVESGHGEHAIIYSMHFFMILMGIICGLCCCVDCFDVEWCQHVGQVLLPEYFGDVEDYKFSHVS